MNSLQRAAQKGGQKKVPKGWAKLSKEARKANARKAALKRWGRA